MIKIPELTRRNVQRFIMLGFSAVIMQLLYISLIVTATNGSSLSDYALKMSFEIPEMLDNTAVTALCVLGGGYLMELALTETGD